MGCTDSKSIPNGTAVQNTINESKEREGNNGYNYSKNEMDNDSVINNNRINGNTFMDESIDYPEENDGYEYQTSDSPNEQIEEKDPQSQDDYQNQEQTQPQAIQTLNENIETIEEINENEEKTDQIEDNVEEKSPEEIKENSDSLKDITVENTEENKLENTQETIEQNQDVEQVIASDDKVEDILVIPVSDDKQVLLVENEKSDTTENPIQQNENEIYVNSD